ncbi:methyl-accepting chemotaxis protein [Clostridium thermopalmarium]|uniref:Methyl-accepting chemotaxis protein McpB n=1 Tax=Clostridium thermopalmarium DSM 5974 TaxID=1121340 RepID=A0A2T0AQU6_9CLOT|nr:methyl-accepting chemotaxis protein [Clostridium thermopalmarium]PRR71804.1 Methyl-accepting chemotaxis protein McpB [Clostridium thermopalmarium DSM 5974]PVZ21375.1 methyl-accepting chemotaxis sensory transducer with Cache sensor [Clostridium thermopalmarium DSM 5974]
MKNGGRNLQKQIILLITFAILVPLVLVSGISYYIIEENIRENFHTKAQASIGDATSIIQNVITNNMESIQMLSEDPNAKDILSNKNSEFLLKRSLDSFLRSHKGISNVYIGTVNNKFITAISQTIPKRFDLSQREWYKKALETPDKVVVTNPYQNGDNKNEYDISIARAIKDASGKVVGVASIDINLTYISNLIKEISIGNNGYVIVVNKDGNIISHKDSSKIGKNIKEDKTIETLVNTDESIFNGDIDGTSYRVFKSKEDNTGYTILGVIPRVELEATLHKIIYYTIMVTVATLVLAIIVTNMVIKRSITNPIKKIVGLLDGLSKGDFTADIHKDKKLIQELESIIDAIDETRNGVLSILQGIVKVSEDLKSNSQSLMAVTEESSAIGDEVAKAVQQISEGSVSQSEKLAKSVSLSEELGKRVDGTAKSSENMINASKEAKEVSEQGVLFINDLSQAFEESYIANLDVVEKVEELDKKSSKIGDITNVIKDITEQTNLLALNASIEAARAGEAGKGFAVVADEVRKLAEESANSALEIEKVINEVKLSVNEVFEKLKYSTELSDKTALNVSNTKNSFDKIKVAIEELEGNVENVNYLLRKMKEDKDAVIMNISEVSAVAEEIAATSQEVSASSEEQASGLQEIVLSAEKLDSYSNELKQMINKFKI